MLEEKKLYYYLNHAKQINPRSCDKDIRIAILGSFTLNGLEEILRVKCSEIFTLTRNVI